MKHTARKRTNTKKSILPGELVHLVKLSIFVLLLISYACHNTIHITMSAKAKKEVPTPKVERSKGYKLTEEEAKNWPKGETRSKYRVQFDFTYKGVQGKKMDPESDTVPDLNLTVTQLLQNHTRGQDSNVTVRQPLYMDFPIPNLKDITDVHELLDAVTEQKNDIETFIKESKETEEQLAEEARLLDEDQASKAEQREQALADGAK